MNTLLFAEKKAGYIKNMKCIASDIPQVCYPAHQDLLLPANDKWMSRNLTTVTVHETRTRPKIGCHVASK